MNKVAIGVTIVIILLLGALGWAASTHLPNGNNNPSATTQASSAAISTTPVSPSNSSTLSSSEVASSQSTSTAQSTYIGNWLSDDPSFVNGSSKIDYPPDFAALKNYTLGLINADREAAGLALVTLSTVPSGQQHADSMAHYGTIGHWDVQGYKPYMRYTLLGGTGYVAENVDQGYCTNSPVSDAEVILAPCSIQTIENGIAGGEYSFMNRDVACCNNGHRDNILGAQHNRVSIGIAYSAVTDTIYLVEDFEDALISAESLQVSGGVITLSGLTQQDLTGWTSNSSGAEIGVYFDPTPTAIPTSELITNVSCDQYSELSEPPACQYQGGYNQGTLVTTVLAPCPPGYTCSSTGGFSFAQTWSQSAGSFSISISLAGLDSSNGPRVYTIYLWPNGDKMEPITSLSVFVAGP